MQHYSQELSLFPVGSGRVSIGFQIEAAKDRDTLKADFGTDFADTRDRQPRLDIADNPGFRIGFSDKVPKRRSGFAPE